jgi:hypothetical protein
MIVINDFQHVNFHIFMKILLHYFEVLFNDEIDFGIRYNMQLHE